MEAELKISNSEQSDHPVIVAMNNIISFAQDSMKYINLKKVDEFLDLLETVYREKKKVLVMGAGRSGLVARAFGMRLLHMGFRVYALGDTLVPSVNTNDLVIAVSGSGSTKLIVTAAETAKSVGAKVVAITSYPDSPLGRIADLVIVVPGRTKTSHITDYFARQILGVYETTAPLGTLFEDTVSIFLDGVVYALMKRLKINEDDMKSKHANIEL
ncbi:MAG: 6-phospho-3-hexuloisomerase [Acidilobaceae archaeon]